MSDIRTVREHIARSRTLLRRQEPVQALRMLASALEQYAGIKVMGPQRFEAEAAFGEALADCNHHPDLQPVLIPPSGDKPVQLKLVRGKEAALGALCNALAAKIEQAGRQQEQEAERERLERRKVLIGKAKGLLNGGDLPKARAFIRKLLDEYGANDPELHLSMAEGLRGAGMVMDAAELLETAISLFPKESVLYTAAIDNYAGAGKFDMAEAVFKRVLRQFGAHPKSFLTMAQLYAVAGRKEKAAELLYQILQSHPDFEEARGLMEYLGMR